MNTLEFNKQYDQLDVYEILKDDLTCMEDFEFVVHDYLFSELHLLEIFLKIRI